MPTKSTTAKTRKPAAKKAPKCDLHKFNADMAKSYGMAASFTSGEEIEKGWEMLPTPSIILNHKLCGGFPLGGITTIAGQKGAGKTTLALETFAADQKRIKDPKAIWVIADVECSIERGFLESKGLDTERTVRLRGPNAEFYGDATLAYMNSDFYVRGFMLDSIAAMVPVKEAESSHDKQFIAIVARVMSRHFPRMVPHFALRKTCALYLNHINIDPGTMFGSPEYETGGKAAGYYALTQLRMNRVKETENGHNVSFAITKNKPGGGYEKGRFQVPFLHDSSFDPESETYAVAKVLDVIQGIGSYVPDGSDEKIIMGRSGDDVKQFFRDNPEIYNEIRAKAVLELDKVPLSFVGAQEEEPDAYD